MAACYMTCTRVSYGCFDASSWFSSIDVPTWIHHGPATVHTRRQCIILWQQLKKGILSKPCRFVEERANRSSEGLCIVGDAYHCSSQDAAPKTKRTFLAALKILWNRKCSSRGLGEFIPEPTHACPCQDEQQLILSYLSFVPSFSNRSWSRDCFLCSHLQAHGYAFGTCQHTTGCTARSTDSGDLLADTRKWASVAPPEMQFAEGALLLQLRDFLQRSLYDPDQGYFTAARANAPVGSVGKALAFPQLAGEDGYRRAVREAYDKLEVSTVYTAPAFKTCRSLRCSLVEDSFHTAQQYGLACFIARTQPALHAGFLADAERDLHALLWPSHRQFRTGQAQPDGRAGQQAQHC